jgi:hypothetical protein
VIRELGGRVFIPSWSGNHSGPIYPIYASIIMALGFLVLLAMPDTRSHSRILED